jgi:hypothetical protein
MKPSLQKPGPSTANRMPSATTRPARTDYFGGHCAQVGKAEHGIQNIDYILNILGGKIPEVPHTVFEIREESGC